VMMGRWLTLALGVGIGVAVATPARAELTGFRTSAQLEDYLERCAIAEMERQVDNGGGHGPGGPIFFRAMAESRDASAAGSSFSTTNVQVAGVDEPDFVKNDGNWIFRLVGENLVVLDATPPTDLREVARVKLDGYPMGMFYTGSKVLVFTNAPVPAGMERPQPQGWGGPMPYARMSIWWPGPQQQTCVKVTTFDVRTKSRPRQVRETFFEGHYVDARLMNGQCHIVTSARPPGPELTYWTNWERQPTADEVSALKAENRRRIRAASLADWLPRSFDKATQSAPAVGVRFWNAYKPATSEGRNIVSVTTMYVDYAVRPEPAGIISESGQIYANASSLYMACYRYDYWWNFNVGTKPSDVTDIHGFRLGGWRPSYLGTGRVDGRVLNQFSMDEYNGNLRVATTTEATAQETGEQQRANHVFVLRKVFPYSNRLYVIGSIRNLAPSERIYSCRFVGDRGYVVTFRQVDPLFCLDMRGLRVKGELKIEGFSTYLHPVTYNRREYLLAIGQAANSEGRVTGLDLTIFDVHDLSRPTLVHRATLQGAYSQALYEHKAYTYFPASSTLVVPVSDWQNGFAGAEVYDVGFGTGFTLRGRIDHKDLASQHGWTWGAEVMRSIIIGNAVYTVSEAGVKANNASTPSIQYGAVPLQP